MSKTEALSKLLSYRDQVENILVEMDAILQIHFSEEYAVAYQHWMPQIKTALRDNTKWLSRGEYSMDYTINHIIDKITNEPNLGVTKYIK